MPEGKKKKKKDNCVHFSLLQSSNEPEFMSEWTSDKSLVELVGVGLYW